MVLAGFAKSQSAGLRGTKEHRRNNRLVSRQCRTVRLKDVDCSHPPDAETREEEGPIGLTEPQKRAVKNAITSVPKSPDSPMEMDPRKTTWLVPA
eukprot:377144-Amorphochlora_amoeboformis.AAC.1